MNLCDSLLYCSFNIDGQQFILNQDLQNLYISAPTFDVSFTKQDGNSYGNFFDFNDDKNIKGFNLTIEKKFLLNETINDSDNNQRVPPDRQYSIKKLTLSQYLSIFSDSLHTARFNHPISYVDRTVFLLSSGISMEILDYKGKSYSSKQESAFYFARGDSSIFLKDDYFKIKEINSIGNNFYIIKGNFRFKFMNYTDTLLLNNGEFKLFIQYGAQAILYSEGDY